MARFDPHPEESSSYKRFFEREEKRRLRRRVFSYVLLTGLIVGGYHFRHDWQPLLNRAPAEALVAQAAIQPIVQSNSAECDPSLPPEGVIHRNELNPAYYAATLPSLVIQSQYGSTVVALLGTPDFSHYDRAFTLSAGRSGTEHVPPGMYGLTLLIGSRWCNLDKGFLDGQRVRISRPIEVIPGLTNKVKLGAIGEDGKGLHVDIIHEMEPQPIQNQLEALNGSGALELRRQSNGGFYLEGRVNQAATTFQVDTGASITSISRELANRAGIFECTPHHFETANGGVSGCMAIAREIVFGSYRFTGFQVAIMPNMKGTLLGMNVLRHMRIEHEGDIMRLGTGAPAPVQRPVAIMPVPTPEQQGPVVAEIKREDPEIRKLQLEDCQQSYQSRKEVIDAAMRQGYSSAQGEIFREQLRRLDEELKNCKIR